METVIMAGGEGRRLRPLTCTRPKPLLRLLEKPVIEYIIDLLIENGINSATVTTGYLAHKITEHFKNGYRNFSLSFSEENEPLGTAGSVLNAVSGKDDVLVISGDALCDFDLRKAINFHRKNHSEVTIIGRRVENVKEFGVIESDEMGRITSFVEKPNCAYFGSNIASTGIYIISKNVLGQIERTEKPDFGKDVFPMLLEKGVPMFLYEETGYWCDIGSVSTFISCQRDILMGKVKKLKLLSRDREGNIIKSPVPETVKIIPPVFIGENVNISPRAHIESGSVIESGASIGSFTRIKGGIIGSFSLLSDKAKVISAIIEPFAKLLSGSNVYEEAVIGERTSVGENSVVLPFVRIWPYKSLVGGKVISENIKLGEERPQLFYMNGVLGETLSQITPLFLSRLGLASGALKKVRSVFIGSDYSDSSVSSLYSFGSAFVSSGKNAEIYEPSSEAEFLFATLKKRPDLAVYFKANSKISVSFFNSNALCLSGEFMREIINAMENRSLVVPPLKRYGKMIFIKGMKEEYLKDLTSSFVDSHHNFSVTVKAADENIKKFAKIILKKLNFKEGNDLVFMITDGGKKCHCYSEETGFVPFEKLVVLASLGAFVEGRDVSVPLWAPSVIDDIAYVYERRVWRYSQYSNKGNFWEARERSEEFSQVRDGMKLMVSLISFFNKTGLNLKSALKLLPSFEVTVKNLELSAEENLRKLSEKIKTADFSEGVSFSLGEGRAFIQPIGFNREIRIYAEASSLEASKELGLYVENVLSGKENLT